MPPEKSMQKFMKFTTQFLHLYFSMLPFCLTNAWYTVLWPKHPKLPRPVVMITDFGAKAAVGLGSNSAIREQVPYFHDSVLSPVTLW